MKEKIGADLQCPESVHLTIFKDFEEFYVMWNSVHFLPWLFERLRFSLVDKKRKQRGM